MRRVIRVEARGESRAVDSSPEFMDGHVWGENMGEEMDSKAKTLLTVSLADSQKEKCVEHPAATTVT